MLLDTEMQNEQSLSTLSPIVPGSQKAGSTPGAALSYTFPDTLSKSLVMHSWKPILYFLWFKHSKKFTDLVP